jgi:hypothetical protein
VRRHCDVTGLIDCNCGACEDDALAELAEAAAQAWLDEDGDGDAVPA